jgi:hypothetical protein
MGIIRVNQKPKRKKKKDDFKSLKGLVKSLGHKSVQDYYRSQQWFDIKDAFLLKNPICSCCDDPATWVHTMREDEPTLSGKSDRFLAPLCSGCRDDLYWNEGRRQSLLSINREIVKRKNTLKLASIL